MAKIIFLIPLVFVILISGCTIPGTDIEIPFIPDIFGPRVVEETADVLVIKSLQALPSKVAPNQQIRLITYIQNLGDDTIPQSDKFTDQELKEEKITVQLYDYCTGLFEKIDISCEGTKIEDNGFETGCKIEKLLPKEIREIDWTLIVADKKHVPVKTQCNLKVYVKYPYTTTSLSTITFIDNKEMQRRIEEGTFKPIQSYISKGEGPIKAHITVEDQQPISVGAGITSTTIALQVLDRGKGFLVKVPATENKNKKEMVGIKKENIHITLPEELKPYSKLCAFKKKNDKKNEYNTKEDIKLIKDKSSPLICKINTPERVPKESTMHMTVNIEYLYEFRKQAKIIVEPKI